jgi:hypothetical protein
MAEDTIEEQEMSTQGENPKSAEQWTSAAECAASF